MARAKKTPQHNRCNVIAAVGASGSGKSAWVKQRLKELNPRRVIVFDVMDEYGSVGRFEKVTTAAAAVLAMQRSEFAVRLVPSENAGAEQFEVVNRAAWEAGETVIVAEELAFFTRPERSPPAWKKNCLRGRHRGLTIFGLTQRPASVDKDFFSTASTVHCGRLNYEADVKTMANVLCVSPADVAMLKPLEYIERDMETGRVSRGKLTF